MKMGKGENMIEQWLERAIAVTLVIVGIIAAIAIPNFLGLLSNYRLEEGLQVLLGAINETQRLAMAKGKSCRININPSTHIITANSPGCLLSDRKISDKIDIRSNFTEIVHQKN